MKSDWAYASFKKGKERLRKEKRGIENRHRKIQKNENSIF